MRAPTSAQQILLESARKLSLEIADLHRLVVFAREIQDHCAAQ